MTEIRYELNTAGRVAETATRILYSVKRIVGTGLEVKAEDPLAQVYQTRLREILQELEREQKKAVKEQEALLDKHALR